MTGLFGVFFYLLPQKTSHYGFGRSRRKVWHAGLNVAFIKLYRSLVCVSGREGSLPGSHATDVFCCEIARASGVTHCVLSASFINRPSNPLAAEAAGRVSHAHLQPRAPALLLRLHHGATTRHSSCKSLRYLS